MRKLRKFGIALLVFLVVIVVFAVYQRISSYIGGVITTSAKYEWPTSGLSTLINKPSSKNGEIYADSEDTFGMYVYKFSLNDFSSYVADCKEKGFTIESDDSDSYYKAFNSEGYMLDMDYYKMDKRLTLSITAPIEMDTLHWPDNGLTAFLPVPSTDKGKIIDNTSEMFYGYVRLTKEAFDAYVKACSSEGFNQDFSQTDTTYSASNADGVLLELIYKGAGTVSIYLNVEEKDEPDELDESDESPDNDDRNTENESDTVTDDVIVAETSEDTQKLLHLAGTDLFTAKTVLSEMEYTPTYYYDYPNPNMIADYTSTVATFDDDFLQQLFITRVENIDTEKKTVAIYINDTNPNETVERTSTISFAMACDAVEKYGKTQYPYGFTLHYLGGMLSNQTYEDGTIMIKANCTIKNALGVKLETICEAKIAGSDESPEITYFFVYDD